MSTNNTRIVITAEDKTRAALDSVVGNLNGVQGALGGLDSIASRLPAIGAMAAAAFGAISFTGIIKGSIDYADSLNELSQRTGVSVETLSSLRNAAELSGTSLEGIGKEVQKLTRNMTEAASGNRTQVENFETLGVAVTDASGKLRSSTDVLLDVARVVGALEDPTERVAAAQLALGKSGGDMVPLLLELAQNGLQVAQVTAEQAANAALLNDQLDMMRQEARSAGESFSISLLPALAAITDVAQGAMFALKQIGSSLAVVANDVMTAATVIGTALSQGPTQTGRDKIRSLLEERRRFVEAANEDLEDRALKYRSTLGQILNPPEAEGGGKGGTSALSERLKKSREELDKGTKGSAAAAKKQVDEMLKRQQEAARQVSDILAQVESGYSPEVEEAMAKQVELQKRQADEIARQVAYYTDLADPAAKYRAEIEKIADLQRNGDMGAETADKATKAIEKQIRGLDGATDAARELGLTFTSAFEDSIVKGKGVSQVLKGLEQDILRIITRMAVTEPLMKSIKGFDIGGLFSGLFGGGGNSVMGIDLSSMSEDVFRADGGPVLSGKGYIVGERGPELFVPNSSGNIVPNHALGGGAPVVQINMINQGTPQKVEQRGQEWDGQKMILTLVAQDIESNGAVGQAVARKASGAGVR